MSKLDEIEALVYTREDLQHDEERVYLKQDVDTLIRAVRQLGAALDEIKYAGGRYDGLLDPDVLELIEEADE